MLSAMAATVQVMSIQQKHLERERLTIEKMIGIYCADHHDGGDGRLCGECSEFKEYAETRLRKCPYGEDKPTCSNCPIHCYKPVRREQVQKIMRYAGPRMLLRHPVLAISHKFDGLRRALHPRELTRAERMSSREGDN
jgi:hypothetical protein